MAATIPVMKAKFGALFVVAVIACARGDARVLVRVTPNKFVDLGRTPIGHNEVQFGVHNDGGLPVTLLAVQSSCTCAATDFPLNQVIRPGEAVTGKLHIDVPGGQRKVVSAILQFAEHEDIVLQVKTEGQMVGIRCNEAIQLPRFVPGVQARFTIPLVIEAATLSRIAHKSFDGDDKQVRVSWRNGYVAPFVFDGEIVAHQLVSGEDLDASIGCTFSSPTPGAGRCRVTASINGIDIPMDVAWECAYPFEVSPLIPILRSTGDECVTQFSIENFEDGTTINVLDQQPVLEVTSQRENESTVFRVRLQKKNGEVPPRNIWIRICPKDKASSVISLALTQDPFE